MSSGPHYYPWHSAVWAALISQVARNRLAHAYLMIGPEGTGRLRFTREFSQWLLCDSPDKLPNQSPCHQCRSCQLWTSRNHPDFFEVTPEVPSKIIKVDAVRALGARINQTSNQAGSKRVILIHPAEAMATAAANALLKGLEEPPDGVVFLLVANADASLLATVRSRCQPIHLPLPETQESMAFLETQIQGQSSEELREALILAADRPMRALEMTQSGVPEWCVQLKSMIKQLESGQGLSMDVAKLCEQQPIDYAIPLLQQLVLEKTRNKALDSDIKSYQTHSHVWQKMYQALSEARAELAGTANINPLMTYEYLFTLWQRAALKTTS